MNSRQRWKLIKKQGPILWQNAEHTYEASDDLPALYDWSRYEARSAYIPAGTKKDQAFIQYVLDEYDMTVTVEGYIHPEDVFHWHKEARND